MLAGLALGVWLRWWAVLVVAAAWALLIGVLIDRDVIVAAFFLAAANAAIGAALGVWIRQRAERRHAV